MVDGEDGVHVAREEELHRRVGTDRRMEVAAMVERHFPARIVDRADGGGIDHLDRARKRGEGVGEVGRDTRQPLEVATARVDRGPTLRSCEGLAMPAARGIDDRLFLIFEAPHDGVS